MFIVIGGKINVIFISFISVQQEMFYAQVCVSEFQDGGREFS